MPINSSIFRRHSANREYGLTLIENLVALVLLSFALLGLAGLLSKTLGRVKDSASHSLAAIQAADMADRMRANLAQFNAGTYQTHLSTTNTNPSNKNCSSLGFGAVAAPAACTAADLAENDAFQWRQWLDSSLPDGTGVVCNDASPDDGDMSNNGCDNNAASPVAIKIFWDTTRSQRATDLTSNTQRFTMVAQP